MLRNYRRRTVWQNPFFPRQMKRKWIWRRKFLVWVSLAVAVIAAALLSPLFSIKHIEIKNLVNTAEDLVRSTTRAEIRRWERTIFFRSAARISALLREKFAFESVDFKIRFPQTIVILVSERRPFARWQTGDEYKIIDPSGADLTKAAIGAFDIDSLPLFAYEIILGEGDTPLPPPATDLPPAQYLKRAAEIYSKFNERFPATRALIRFPGRASTWIKMVTSDGWISYFDLDGNIDAQLNKLSVFLDQGTIDLKTITYIDLRFSDRVYFQ